MKLEIQLTPATILRPFRTKRVEGAGGSDEHKINDGCLTPDENPESTTVGM